VTDRGELSTRFEKMLAAAKRRCDSVNELHKRWNRVVEAIDPVCEDAIFFLDSIGRGEQSDEIHSHMDLEERFDLLIGVFRDEGPALRADAEAADLVSEFEESAFLLENFAPFVAEERERQKRR